MLKPELKLLKQAAMLSASVFIGLVAAWPLFIPRLPHGTDSLTHFYTLIQLDQLMQQGVFYSRWLPYRASGLGTPLFHYYAPLAYYVTQGFNLLSQEPLLALRLAFGLTLVVGAWGIYLWVREVLKQEGSALVAVVAYVCGPYVLFNTFFRGGFAEQFALMLMPLTLWAFRRLAVTGQARYLAASVVTYAALILSHNITAFIFSPVLLAYVLLVAGERPPALADFKPYQKVATLLVAMSLGLGLASFFWLPALVEREAIVAEQLYTLPGLDYHQHFVPLTTLLVAPLTATIRPDLSIMAVGLGVIGLVTVWQNKGINGRDLRRHSFFAALVVAGCVMMALPFSVWIWEAVPPLRFFQFPQRFLGVASLFVAFLTAVGAFRLKQRFKNGRAVSLLFILMGLLLSHTWGLTQVRYYPALPPIDVNFIMQKEREQGLMNTIYSGNFIPATVKTLPSIEQLAQASSQRLDATSLPAGATVIAADYGPLRYEVSLLTPKSFILRFNTFYFPGWQAELDGQASPVMPTEPHGLLGLDVPAGQHHLLIWFGSTPVRTLANILSAGSGLILGGIMVIMKLSKSKQGE
jgi:uncharacterized membrane protein